MAMSFRRVGGYFEKGYNALVGGIDFVKGARGKSTDEIIELGQQIGGDISSKNKIVNDRVDAYESGMKSLKEARKGDKNNDVVSKAIEYKTKAEQANSFEYEGVQYTRIKNENGEYEVRTRGKKGPWVEGSNEDYVKAHEGFVQSQFELGKQQDINTTYTDEATASGIAGASADAWDGVPGWAKGVGLTTAGVLVGSAIAGSDDDDYDG
jgi:hypothetical protein